MSSWVEVAGVAAALRGAGSWPGRVPRIPLRFILGYFRSSLREERASPSAIARHAQAGPSASLRSAS